MGVHVGKRNQGKEKEKRKKKKKERKHKLHQVIRTKLILEIWFERIKRIFHNKSFTWLDRFNLAHLFHMVFSF